MNNVEHQYLELLRKCIAVGKNKEGRNGTTYSLFGEMLSHDMKLGFPLLTTKKVAWRSVLTEFLWFVKGRTDVQWLLERGNTIWLGDVYEHYKRVKGSKSRGVYGDPLPDLTKEEFAHKIVHDPKFNLWGDIGPAYGHQYRRAEFDQLKDLVHGLKTDPHSRRHVVSLWDVKNLFMMTLPPCMWSFQCYVRPDGTLDMLFNIRSSDMPLGLPFNFATSGLFMLSLCHLTGLKEGTIKWVLGDAHIYANQIEGVKVQIDREPSMPPRVELVGKVSDFGNLEEENFVLHSYEHQGKIDFPLSN